jgi:acyl-CoA reductase-like NAD-dependent aldehyde dehydrogenase
MTVVPGPGLDGVAERALAAVSEGFAAYRHLTVADRLAELVRLKQTILERRSYIIDQLTAEVGKCRTDALIAEILGTVDWISWLERNAPRLLAPRKVKTPASLLGKKSMLVHEPLGVVLVICPWNNPFHSAITAIAAAVATGNAVVCKPSEHTPCTGLVEEIISCSPVLRRLVRVVYGDGAMGDALIDAGPAKVFFTGSRSTGSKIMARAAAQLIPVELELGGKDSMIVFDDVPLARPVAGALWGAFTNAGQSRSAVERLLVQDTVYDRFVTALVQEAGKLVVRIDDSGDADTGRMTAAFHRDKMIAHLRDAQRRGARLRYGRIPDDGSLLVEPVIVDLVSTDMLLWREETFGPVLPVMPFTGEAEAVRVANDTGYGLCASVFTKDSRRAMRVARALEVGGVSINNVNMSERNPGLPFGGVKESGFGRLRGPEGLLGFTTSKAVLIDRSSPQIEANWYPYTTEKFRRFNRFIDALYTSRRPPLRAITRHGRELDKFSQKPRDSGLPREHGTEPEMTY